MGVDLHEVGRVRHGVLGMLGAGGFVCPASDGLCGCLAVGKTYHLATGGNLVQWTPQWLKLCAESSSWGAQATLPTAGLVRWKDALGNEERESGLPSAAPTAQAEGAVARRSFRTAYQ